MAEPFVILRIAYSLIEKLGSYAYEEALRVYGVYDDLQGFKDTLSIVSAMLLDAAEKKNKPLALQEWLRQIHNICSDAENILDEFDLQDKRNQAVEASGSILAKASKLISSSNPVAFRLRMANKIKDIKAKLDKVAKDGARFGLTTSVGIVVQQREMTYPDIDASSVIGRENEKNEIINLLMKPHPKGDGGGDKSICVIPIVGIGGLGKTTLAKLVFNDKKIDDLFQLKMWACVSDDFDIKKITIQIINSANAFFSTSSSGIIPHQENINHLDIGQLVSRMRQKLSGQKFLLVLDDVWNDDRPKWLELKNLIKVGAPGSKIIVTTRTNSIASMMGDVKPYVLEGLSPNDCLSLFLKWAFEEGEEKKYPNLVEIGKEIVKKCPEVPLAVRTLGSSLYSKFDISRWEYVRDSEIWSLEQKKDDILPVLKLSYDQMPIYLRQCFPYFSLYPKDHIFDSLVMCIHWIAVGLVQSLDGSETLESIARKYIDELHSRSLIQDVNVYGYHCQFKVHDLIHDLALYVAREDFAAVDSHDRKIHQHVRHLSVLEKEAFDKVNFPESKSVRSILFPIFGLGLESKTVQDTWISRYKYLRYLKLSDSSFETIPNSIAELDLLRFLDLSRNYKIKTLPSSICKLLHLQVLNLNGCTMLENLPQGLEKLTSLRHLYVTTKQSIFPFDKIVSLIHLQTLGFHSCDNIKFLFKKKLPSIVQLQFESCGCLESVPLNIFPNLQTLHITNCDKLNLLLNNESQIQTLRLKHLHLRGFSMLVTLPEWIVRTMNTLETLDIRDFSNLKMLPVFLTTMTCLKRLYIFDCPKLLSLKMHRLTALEELYIVGCPELCRKCRHPSGEYWPMIKYIKTIYIGKPTGEKEE